VKPFHEPVSPILRITTVYILWLASILLAGS
jgi:hypothetical protein